MSEAPRRAVEYSRGAEAENPLPAEQEGSRSVAGGVLAILALIGVAALIAATFLPVLRISIGERVITELDRTGWDEHGPALLALALFALALLPAALRGATAAGVAIAVCGLAALLIAVIADLPDIGDTGAVGERLRDAEVGAGVGAYAETLGGVLLLASGGLLAFLSRREDA